jgi:hypothetical protein
MVGLWDGQKMANTGGKSPYIGERQGVSPPSQTTEFLACVCELRC